MRGYVKLALFLAVVFLGGLIAMPLHEYGHYIVGTALGLEGAIYFDHVTFTTPPDILTKLAGGLIAGAALLALAALSRKPYGYGFLPAAITHFSYAPFDSAPGSQFLGAIVMGVASFIIGIYLVNAGKLDDDLYLVYTGEFEVT